MKTPIKRKYESNASLLHYLTHVLIATEEDWTLIEKAKTKTLKKNSPKTGC
jgi:hypothetical protein